MLETINILNTSIELATEEDQIVINFDVITDVIVNTSVIVAQAQTGAIVIPLQQQIDVNETDC